MARQHVFPLCLPTFKKTEVTGVLGEEKTFRSTPTQLYYFQDGERDVEFNVPAPGEPNEGELRILTVVPEYFFGEYLLDHSNEVSIPDHPQSIVNRVFMPNSLLSSVFFEDRVLGTITNPSEGAIFCIGLKVGDLYNSYVMSLLNYIGEPPIYSERPFPGSSWEPAVDLNKNAWVTLMFTGTRWVILGSNNWY